MTPPPLPKKKNVRYLSVILSVGSDTHGQADNPVLVLSEVFYIMGLSAQCNNK